MKAITILSTLIITISSCNCQKKATDTAMITSNDKTETVSSANKEDMTINQTLPVLVYESMSRGYFRRISIENGKIAVQNARGEESKIVAIASSDIKLLEEAYKGVNPKEFPNLKAPTEKRFYDGAPITNLIVKKGEETFRTSDFDGGFPPAEIKNLVETILKIADKIK
ncbi:hypothetical protein FIA58_007430 [Flavobacterium jejuense]|uniref:Lipoprotein n=1 Tax=Flavobacterium jejuense TaxID=1544455 RepID=A0ABX0INX7_9FLAO|nr:hypothetical protein [Flavobacterium jejuense]NHN25505.1 hypothetical protein [Flavobacterium jejuense]